MIENEIGNRGSKSGKFSVYLVSEAQALRKRNTWIGLILLQLIAFNSLTFIKDSLYLSLVLPVVIYINSDLKKLEIIKDNKGKSGIYRWVNKDSGKTYVGSSINLGRRLNYYYNVKTLRKGTMQINKAQLKYGHAQFSLEILEYCQQKDVIRREQYYLDLLSPKYNIKKIAGASNARFKYPVDKKTHFGKHRVGVKRAEGAGSPSIPIEVLNIETQMKTTYPSMNETGRALGVPCGSIRMYFSRNTQNPYKNKYVQTKLINPLSGRKMSTRITVNEQRVNGSWDTNYNLICVFLRCTLNSFERNCQIKKLYKAQYESTTLSLGQQLNVSSISSANSFKNGLRVHFRGYSTLKTSNIHPWWWTGFIDAEGCFSVNITKSQSIKLGWAVQPSFTISAHSKDAALLQQLQLFLGGIGSIFNRKYKMINYTITSKKDQGIFINYLDAYPLLTKKAADYIQFKEIIKLNNKVTITEFSQIINLRSSLNYGLSRKLRSNLKFLDIVPVNRPVINTLTIPDPNWISGFVSGDGCFMVLISKATRATALASPYGLPTKIKERVRLKFVIAQHKRDIKQMYLIINYIGAGNVYPFNKMADLVVNSWSDHKNIIKPFFDKYPVIGVKRFDYLDWCRVLKLMEEGSHLTNEGKDLIKEIKSKMNTGRVI